MIFKTALLSFVQSITEFLPISSSGHLLLVEKIFGFKEFDLSFNILIHLASGLALVIFFFREWVDIFKETKINFINSLFFKIIIGSIPALFLGLVLKKTEPPFWQSEYIVISNLIVFGVVLLLADTIKGRESIKELKTWKALLIGVGQALALVPGVSRSGITISIALFLGLSRKESARFSFLLAAPAILAANILEFSNFEARSSMFNYYIFGFILTFILSYLTIWWLLKYLERNRLWPFSVWRFIVALITLVLIFIR